MLGVYITIDIKWFIYNLFFLLLLHSMGSIRKDIKLSGLVGILLCIQELINQKDGIEKSMSLQK
jgi:hypothetical protein